MVVTALVLAALAALLHVYIFYRETFAWTTPRVRATFGTSEAQAVSSKELAFNQGFYNLFLAVLVALGIFFFAVGDPVIGATLVFAGAGCMLAAALVLLVTSPGKARAAITQGTLPLLAVIVLAIGLAL